MSSQSVAKALPELPLEQVKAAIEQYPEVQLIIKRQTAKGTWASLPNQTMPTVELATIDEWLRNTHGGGRYRVSPRNPQNELEEVISAFYAEIPGAPKPPATERQRAPSPFGPGYGVRPGGVPWNAMPYVRNIVDSKDDDDKDKFDPSMFMSQTPDAIAMEQVRELRAELREMRSERERDKQEAERKIDQEREAKARLEKEQQKQQQQHEKELMELRMQLIAAQSAPKGPQVDWVALLVGMAPVFKGLIDSSKDRQALQLQAQQESAKLQTQGLQTMIQTLEKGSKKDDTLKDLVPLVMPLILKMMDEKSPGAVTKLISAMADNQLQTISMVSQLMQQMTPDNDNPWMDVARKAIEGVQSVAEQMVEVQAVKTGAAPNGRSNGSRLPAQAAPKELGPHSTPKDFADALLDAPNLPSELRTQQWHQLFQQIHDVRMPAKDTAAAISQHLEHLADKNKLPAMFDGVLDESENPPSSYLRPFLQQLPIAQLSPKRLEALCQAFDEVLTVNDDQEAAEQPASFTQ